MIKRYIHTLLSRNREFLLHHILAIQGLMKLLMKQRNTGEKWTRTEKKLIKQHLRTMAKAIPLIIVFLPPGGGILLPLLVDLMDRRKRSRASMVQSEKDRVGGKTAECAAPENSISS